MEAVSNNEREFILSALQTANLRVDGRPPLSLRAIRIAVGRKAGTVEVQLGGTRAVACVTADIVAPFPDRPAEGFLNFFVNFSPLAALDFEQNRPNEKAVEAARVVERGIRDSRAIDTEALCILAGEKVWSIRVDVHIVDHCGNLIDVANLAALVALKSFRRPDVSVIGDAVTVHPTEDRQPVALAVHHIPIAMTFAFFHDGKTMVLDPTLKEEQIAQGTMTITTNAYKELCCVHKGGGVAIDMDTLLRCTNVALSKALELTQLIEEKLKEAQVTDAMRRSELVGGAQPIDMFGRVVTKQEDNKSLNFEADSGGTLEDGGARGSDIKAPNRPDHPIRAAEPLVLTAQQPAAAADKIFQGGSSGWDADPPDEEADAGVGQEMAASPSKPASKKKRSKKKKRTGGKQTAGQQAADGQLDLTSAIKKAPKRK